MSHVAASHGDDLDEVLVRWVLQGRDDALRSSRESELPGWARALDFLMRTTAHDLLLKVAAEFEATRATFSDAGEFLAAAA